MQNHFPTVQSTLSPDALAAKVFSEYNLGNISACSLYSGGFNDTYQVKTVSGNMFYLRAYRTPWRSPSDIRCELDALVYLHRKGFPVAYPLPSKDGSLYTEVNAPEGPRMIALFALAEGVEPSYDQEPEQKTYQYGRLVAQLHNALDGFSSPHLRFHLDLDHLIDKPLRVSEPFLSHRPDLWTEFHRIASRIRRQIHQLPASSLEWGFCHGDLQGYHHRIAQDGKMTFIDFDCGGFGYRAYDLAVFRWCARLSDSEAVWWPPYLRGYLELRPLAELDMHAVPLFVGCRYIWHIGVHCENAPSWGIASLNDAYFEQKVKFLQQVEADYAL